MSKKIADDIGFGRYEPKVHERRVKTAEQALSTLMDLCSKSEKSSGDATRLMYRWGVDAGAHEGVLEKLIETSFIDDRRYAQAYLNDRMSFSGWGAHKIRRSLVAKGVSNDIITDVMSSLEADGQRERLMDMLEKKNRSLKDTDNYKRKGKLMRYGMTIGYGYEDVMECVDRVMNEIE